MGEILVKVCGLTRREDAAAAISAGADLVGFVLVPATPRAVDPGGLSWVRELRGAATVGVFRDAPVEWVVEVREALRFDWVQLHGGEPDRILERLGDRVLRRVSVAGGVDWRRVGWLAERCLPLVDPGAGDGVTCDWSSLATRPRPLRFGLAGGLSPGNVGEAIRLVKPALVDVSTGVESAPGIKDAARIEAFVANARAAAEAP